MVPEPRPKLANFTYSCQPSIGWGHEVITLEGQVYAGTDTALAVNWVSWCLPKHLAIASVMAMLAGITKEDQRTVQRALSKPQRAQMLAIAGAWASKQ